MVDASGAAGPADAPAATQRDPMDRALDGIQRLQQLYRFERFVFIGAAIASLLFTAALGVVILASGNATAATMLPLLGSGGAFMGTAAGSMYFFGKAFDLLSKLATGAAGANG